MILSLNTGIITVNCATTRLAQRQRPLVLVLSYPTVPLHNNDSELGARDQARRRDMSFHTMSDDGTAAKDTFMTLAQTARKLSVNFYHYVFDRIRKKYDLLSLDFLITQRATQVA